MNKQVSLPECSHCPIHERAICGNCTLDEIARLHALNHHRSFRAGDVIVQAGQRQDFMASVMQGMLSLGQTLEDGRTQLVGLLGPADFLGRPGRELAPFTVAAITDGALCAFRREPFEKLMQEIPSLRGRLLDMTLDELDSARAWMTLLGRKNARERIASLLIYLGDRAVPRREMDAMEARSFALCLTREDMADRLGLTLETVSRQLSQLQRDGLIELHANRRVTVWRYSDLLAESGEGETFASVLSAK